MSAGDLHSLASAPSPTFDLPRDEMAFRPRYENLLLAQAISTVFRPGNRTWPHWRGYLAGETVTARVIERCGDDALRIAPRFNSVRVGIRLLAVTVLPVEALSAADFAGSSPDVTDIESLLTHLRDIYGRPIDDYGRQVTRIRFAYVERPRPGQDWLG